MKLKFYVSFTWCVHSEDGSLESGFGSAEGEHEGPITSLLGLEEHLRQDRKVEGLTILSIIPLPVTSPVGNILVPRFGGGRLQ